MCSNKYLQGTHQMPGIVLCSGDREQWANMARPCWSWYSRQKERLLQAPFFVPCREVSKTEHSWGALVPVTFCLTLNKNYPQFKTHKLKKWVFSYRWLCNTCNSCLEAMKRTLYRRDPQLELNKRSICMCFWTVWEVFFCSDLTFSYTGTSPSSHPGSREPQPPSYTSEFFEYVSLSRESAELRLKILGNPDMMLGLSQQSLILTLKIFWLHSCVSTAPVLEIIPLEAIPPNSISSNARRMSQDGFYHHIVL